VPGLNLVIGNGIHIDDSHIASRLKYLSNYKYVRLLKSSNVYLSYSGYEEYPISHFQCSGFDVYIEGVIYDMSDVQVMSSMLRVLEALRNGKDDMADDIRYFVEAADGDFFVVAVDGRDRENSNGRYVAFNDKHSRLPIHWCFLDSGLVVSRDLNFVLSIVEPSTDIGGLAEYMIFSHTLGEKTIFSSIQRTKESHAFWSINGSPCLHSSINTRNRFDAHNKYDVCKESCVAKAASLFEESCSNRVSKLEPLSGSLVTLSGGFDSRTVYAGIRKAGSRALPITFKLVTGDESEYAQAVAHEFEDDVAYLAVPDLRIRDVANVQRAKDIIRFTEGQEPLHHCYPNFLLFQRLAERFPQSRICYLGFGGEWIRHPYKPKRWQRTIRDILWNWRKQIAMLCRMSDFYDEDNVYEYLESEIERACSEYDLESIMKWMYYQYYNGFVIGGEERCRLHRWTVSPLLSLGLVDFYLDYLPLEYADLQNYIKFMTLVDKRTGAVDTNHVSLSKGKVTDVKHSVASSLRQIIRKSKAMCTVSDVLLSAYRERASTKSMFMHDVSNPFGLKNQEISLMCKEVNDMQNSVEVLSQIFSDESVSRGEELNCSLAFLDKLFTLYAYTQATM
jgi:hypothetical protein